MTRSHDIDPYVRRLEDRIAAGEVTQKTTAQRFDELFKALSERLTAKDDTISQLKEQSEWILKQNDTLLKQIGMRWNLLTGLMTLVGIAFTITLGYQIFRVEQVMEMRRALEDGTKILSENTKTYTQILSALARSDSMLTDSNREFQRAEYSSALVQAVNSIDFLKSAFHETGLDVNEIQRRSSYDGVNCTVTQDTAVMLESKRAEPNGGTSAEAKYALSPEALRPAIQDALFSAYELHARATFFSVGRSGLREDGKMLLALDPGRWEGYHWIGLAAESEGSGSYREAAACFRKSVDKNKVGNRDYVNLAELSFIDANYSEAVRYGDQYLHPLGYRFKSAVDVIAQFYFSTAGFLAGDKNALNRMPPSLFKSKVDELADFSLEGTFSPGDLHDFLHGNEFKTKVGHDEQNTVLQSFDCLVKRQCK
jgi:hypothetical protein